MEKSQPQNKLRRFRAANSAGLRIRSHPTLQSEQVGIIKMDGIISFIDEVCRKKYYIKLQILNVHLSSVDRLKMTMVYG